jgi:hypothetical protein
MVRSGLVLPCITDNKFWESHWSAPRLAESPVYSVSIWELLTSVFWRVGLELSQSSAGPTDPKVQDEVFKGGIFFVFAVNVPFSLVRRFSTL